MIKCPCGSTEFAFEILLSTRKSYGIINTKLDKNRVYDTESEEKQLQIELVCTSCLARNTYPVDESYTHLLSLMMIDTNKLEQLIKESVCQKIKDVIKDELLLEDGKLKDVLDKTMFIKANIIIDERAIKESIRSMLNEHFIEDEKLVQFLYDEILSVI